MKTAPRRTRDGGGRTCAPDLGDRLRQMRDTDPSPTVRQWAPYFLQRKAR